MREIRTLCAMWRALETEHYGVTAPVLDPTRSIKELMLRGSREFVSVAAISCFFRSCQAF